MEKPTPDPAWHRQQATELFNDVWDILDKSDRTDYDIIRMIHMAHASVWHWSFAGEAVNMARGEWQVSRVYATVKMPESALFHARRSLAICVGSDLRDFDLAFAHEAMARAQKLCGLTDEANTSLQLAREAGNAIKDPGDQAYFFSELATI